MARLVPRLPNATDLAYMRHEVNRMSIASELGPCTLPNYLSRLFSGDSLGTNQYYLDITQVSVLIYSAGSRRES